MAHTHRHIKPGSAIPHSPIQSNQSIQFHTLAPQPPACLSFATSKHCRRAHKHRRLSNLPRPPPFRTTIPLQLTPLPVPRWTDEPYLPYRTGLADRSNRRDVGQQRKTPPQKKTQMCHMIVFQSDCFFLSSPSAPGYLEHAIFSAPFSFPFFFGQPLARSL